MVEVEVRLDRRLVETGDVQQVGQQILGAFQRLVRAFHQYLLGVRQAALAQRRDQQPGGVERLQQVVTGRSEVFVLAAVGGLGSIPGLDQLVGALGDALFQLVIELLQAGVMLLAFGNIGDEALHHALLVRPQQQVHQYIDAGAVLALQLGLVTKQGTLALQFLDDRQQLGLATDEQVPGKVSAGQQQLLRVGVAKHARHGRVGSAQTVLEAGLEDTVHRVLEQPGVAVALGFQLVEARRQLRVVTLADGVVAQPQQPGQRGIARFRGPRHTPPRRRAGSTPADW